jgi:hypothetical protein
MEHPFFASITDWKEMVENKKLNPPLIPVCNEFRPEGLFVEERVCERQGRVSE